MKKLTKKTTTVLLAVMMVVGMATAAWAGTTFRDHYWEPGERHFVEAGRTESGNGDVRLWVDCHHGDTDERFDIHLERRVYGLWQTVSGSHGSMYCDQIATWTDPHWSSDDYRVSVRHNTYADGFVDATMTAYTSG